MKTLKYNISINAAPKKVWKTLLDTKEYDKWAKAFSGNSTCKGEWKEGETISFIDPEFGGTKAIVETIDPFNSVAAKHIAIINQDGTEDTESDQAKEWIGTEERYRLINNNQTTELWVEIFTHENNEEMFNSSWPKALKLLKKVAEQD